MRVQRSRPTTLCYRDKTLAVHGGAPRLCTAEAWSAGDQVESVGACTRTWAGKLGGKRRAAALFRKRAECYLAWMRPTQGLSE